MERPLWQPSEDRRKKTRLHRFLETMRARHDATITDYAALHRWSIENRATFWAEIWDEGKVIAETRGERRLVDGDKMPGAQFFPDAKLNFAENLLRRRDDGTALIFWGEDKVKRSLTYRELYDQVSRLSQALKAEGVGVGDRVAGFMPNMPETIIAMLAAASLGAIWSSCSPDFGVKGVMDRFGQIKPKILFTADGYFYNGKTLDSLERAAGIAAELPELKRLIVVPYTRAQPPLEALGERATTFGDFIAGHAATEIDFVRLPFAAPLYILYSSGTTGLPKCMIHGAGGTLLKHLEEIGLNCDVQENDRLFYFTTCGWMMWNWLVSGLALGATLLLYDGSPFYPSPDILFDFADATGMTHFGTSAKFIDALSKAGREPIATHRLGSIRTILSTGSPLAPASFDYVYEKVKKDVCLSSMAGGTDLVGSFVGGNPIGPVWRGEIQAKLLGMAVEVFDDDGHAMKSGAGELVCTRAFPSMPLGFWNDPDGRKYHDAYFATYPNVWRHGDWIEEGAHGGVIIYGRSDAVLNPGGVRIGTAEIYRQVELLDEVVEGLVIGQQWDNDVRVVLFVRLRDGLTLTPELTAKIKEQIRRNATPRHVPAKVIQVADIPRTISGKIVEIAVRDIVHGRPVKNKDALANPEALALFADLPELRS